MRWSQALGRFFNGEKVFQLTLVAPLQLLMWVLLIVPTVIVVYLSVVGWQPILGVDWWQAPFVGLENYLRVLSDARFWEAVGRTLLMVVFAVAAEFALGLGLALLFRAEFVGKRLATSVLLYPMMLPWVVVGFAFYLVFLDRGPVNYLLTSLFGPGAAVDWFRYPTLAIATIVAADIWQWTPFMFLILYSGLSALPKEPTEAAMTLGASQWQIFRYITLPMLRPVIVVAVVLRVLEALKIFDLVYIMTGGGPGTSTESLSLYIYRVGFVYGQLSYAAAMAVVILVGIALVTRLAVRSLELRLQGM
ncbi:MAG: sugar ABC transporter permease [Bacillota bacterium]